MGHLEQWLPHTPIKKTYNMIFFGESRSKTMVVIGGLSWNIGAISQVTCFGLRLRSSNERRRAYDSMDEKVI